MSAPPRDCVAASGRWQRLLSALAILVQLAGCSARLAQPNASWRSLRSPHFTLHTDMPLERARERSALLERYFAAYLENGWDLRGEEPGRLNVVMFANPGEFSDYEREPAVGGYYNTSMFEPWAVLPASGAADELRVLLHELNHHIAYAALQNQPFWFSEGIATYFETARFEEESFVIGAVPAFAYRALFEEGVLPPARLFAATSSPRAALYANAWLLVHYLISHHDASFREYQRALAAGKSHELAWSQAFPELTPLKLAAALRDYARDGEFYSFRRPVAMRSVPIEVKELTAADQHALRAYLFATCRNCDDAREKRLESARRALSLDPHHVDATALAALEEQTTLEQVRELTRAKPDSWLAWLSLAHVAARSTTPRRLVPEAFEAVRRALVLEPRQAHARMLAAELYFAAGQRDDALTASATALRLLPTDLGLLIRRALLLGELRECEALRPTVAAILVVSHGELSESALERVRRAEARCEVDAAHAAR